MRIAPYLEPFRVPIDSLHTDEHNARSHPSANITDIGDSLREFGQVKPIIIDANHMIRAGNGTWIAAKQIGAKEIAACKADHLSEEELLRYELADNAVGDSSRWDDVLALAKLQQTGPVPGFSQEDINKLLASLELRDQQTQNSGSGGVGIGREIDVKVGDIFAAGEHRIMCGDSTNKKHVARLMDIKADIVFTDPPYGVSYDAQSDQHDVIMGDELRDDKLLNELIAPALVQAVKFAKDDAPFYIWHASATRRDFEEALQRAGLVEQQYIIWDKGTFVLGWGHYRNQAEPCFYAAKQGHKPRWNDQRDQSTVWKVGRVHDENLVTALASGLRITDGEESEIFIAPKAPKGKKIRLVRVQGDEKLVISATSEPTDLWQVERDSAKSYIHATQKPAELAMKALSNHTVAGDVVLDLFGGSGSTLMAAERMGRRARLMELDVKYVLAIIHRYERETGKEAVKE